MFRIESGDEYQNAILPSTLPLVALLNEWHTLNIQSGLKNAFITSTIPSSSKTITKTFSKLNQTIHTGIHHLNIITAKSCQLPMSFFDSSSSIEFNALITTSADKSLRVTCAVHSKVLTLATFQSSILTVSLHPKLRNILLTTSMDGTHGLLDLKTMEYQKIYKDHSKYVVASGFNNSGIYFATGSYDKTVKVYKQVDDGYDIAFTMTFGTAVESLCFIKRTGIQL